MEIRDADPYFRIDFVIFLDRRPVQMQSIEFLPLAVNPANYPKSRLSMLPSAARIAWQSWKNTKATSAFLDCNDFFAYGRYALVEALRRAGIEPGMAVLLPSYHCRTIVESVLHLQAEVRFYPLTPDLRPDFSMMHELVADGRARALLLTHYFGFANALDEARQFCSANNVCLIEDCAHAFYGEHDGRALGSVGEFSVASAWKFLPLRGGALLRDNMGTDASLNLRPHPLKSEIKAMLALIKLLGRVRLGKTDLSEPDSSELIQRVRTIAAADSKPIGSDDAPFQPSQVDMAGLATSRWLIAHAPHTWVMNRRRENFLHWLEGVRNLPGVRPLFSSLPDGTVPYAFPLLTDAGGLVFHALKLAGIPIWRWEDVVKTDCPVSGDYRIRLLQLPCHQDLSQKEIAWMINVMRAVLPDLAA